MRLLSSMPKRIKAKMRMSVLSTPGSVSVMLDGWWYGYGMSNQMDTSR